MPPSPPAKKPPKANFIKAIPLRSALIAAMERLDLEGACEALDAGADAGKRLFKPSKARPDLGSQPVELWALAQDSPEWIKAFHHRGIGPKRGEPLALAAARMGLGGGSLEMAGLLEPEGILKEHLSLESQAPQAQRKRPSTLSAMELACLHPPDPKATGMLGRCLTDSHAGRHPQDHDRLQGDIDAMARLIKISQERLTRTPQGEKGSREHRDFTDLARCVKTLAAHQLLLCDAMKESSAKALRKAQSLHALFGPSASSAARGPAMAAAPAPERAAEPEIRPEREWERRASEARSALASTASAPKAALPLRARGGLGRPAPARKP